MMPTKENFFEWLFSSKSYPTGTKLLHIGDYFEFLNPGKKYSDKSNYKVTPTYNVWCKKYLECKDSLPIKEWAIEWCKSNDCFVPHDDIGPLEGKSGVKGYCIMICPHILKKPRDDLNWLKIQMKAM